MMQLAHFYKWSLKDIRTMSAFDMEQAMNYMVEMRKAQAKQQQGGQRRG